MNEERLKEIEARLANDWSEFGSADGIVKELAAEVRRLRAGHKAAIVALDEAIGMISGEFCSHGDDHGASNDSCYAKAQYAARAALALKAVGAL